MGEEKIASISSAISNQCIKSEAWHIEMRDPCDDLQTSGSGPKSQCEQELPFQVTAKYKSARNGAELYFYVPQPRVGLLRWFSQPTAIHYFAKINGRKIYLLDSNTDNSSATGLNNSTIPEMADGKITQHDLLSIDGFTYSLFETSEPGIFEFRDETNDQAKYNGLRLRRNGDQWVFDGPDSRGKELEELLTAIARQYSFTLSEAEKDA